MKYHAVFTSWGRAIPAYRCARPERRQAGVASPRRAGCENKFHPLWAFHYYPSRKKRNEECRM